MADLTPRKRPTQARSRATVSRIIEAGNRILFADGYEAMTTSRVAEAAGVSPGSLYQYFPNREAIAIAVAGRVLEEFSEQVMTRFVSVLGESPEDFAPALTEHIIAGMEERREVFRVILEELPAREGRSSIAAFERRVTEVARGYAASQDGAIRSDDAEVALWIIIRATGYLMMRYVVDRPPISRERYAREVARLALGYVAPDGRDVTAP